MIVSGVVPYLLTMVGEAYPDMGLGYMLNVAIPASIPLGFYCLVIIWGLRLVMTLIFVCAALFLTNFLKLCP